MQIPSYLKEVREIKIGKEDLLKFEEDIKELYEDAKIISPVHLSKGNENEVIEIFKYVHPEDWVFSSWRNHYHALLHGMGREKLLKDIVDGYSMSTNSVDPKFYSSSIVAGIIPIAIGVAKGLKMKGSVHRVWCFIGDMTFETGIFYESYKYATNMDLPIQFVVEDNGLSTNTPTAETWGNIKKAVPDNVIYYSYERGYPHHGTGNWVLF
jgi:pyruvate dehydrogenase E1 component alpha subunit